MLGMAICLASGVKAQFYDSADDIYYYVECDKNGEIKEDGHVYIFNFDGQKACFWHELYVNDVKNHFKYDGSSYYEEKVETTEYLLKYTSGNTYKWNNIPYYKKEAYREFYFSYDRKTMIYTDHREKPILNQFGLPTGFSEWVDDKTNFKKVEKSFFKVGRSRTPSGTMHE